MCKPPLKPFLFRWIFLQATGKVVCPGGSRGGGEPVALRLLCVCARQGFDLVVQNKHGKYQCGHEWNLLGNDEFTKNDLRSQAYLGLQR